MPRQKKHDRPKRKELMLPTSVVDAIDERLKDRFTGKPVHGAWSELVTKLLKDWMEANQVEVDLSPSDKRFCELCLKDLPLKEDCNKEGCHYERV